MLHGEEPLLAETRLNSCVLVAFRVAYLVVIILNLLHQASRLKVKGNLLADIHAVLTYIHACSLRDCAVWIEDVDSFEVVSLAESVVVDVVSWSNLKTSCTELDIHIAVFDDRDDTSHKRHDDLVTTEPLVLRVLRVDAHSSVTHDSLRACGGNDSIIASVSILVKHFTLFACRLNRIDISISHIVAEMVKLRLLITVDNLLSGKHCLCLWIPVDHAKTTVDETLLVEVNEYLQH